MKILIYVCILILFLILLFVIRDMSFSITLICSLFVISFIINPIICIKTCISGTSLFFYKVFPSLFPFLVVCNMILLSNGVYIYSKLFGKILCLPLGLPLQCSFVVMISALCGYPLGSKYSCELYEQGEIDFNTCERLLNIASNASPLFIIGTIGTSMMKDTNLGYILLLSSYISCFIMSIFLRKDRVKASNYCFHINKSIKIDMGNIFKNSIDNAIKTTLSVCGFIILFSVINGIIKNSILFNAILSEIYYMFNVPKTISEGMLLGLMEMTNGCNIITSSNLIYDVKIILLGFLIGFSGICILLQCNSFMSKHKFSLAKYTKRKILQGIICSLTSYTLYKLLYHNASLNMFNNTTNNLTHINFTIFIIVCFLLFIPFLGYKLRDL